MGLNQSYAGRAIYYPDRIERRQQLLVAVLCEFGDLPAPVHALLDTGSHWCVIPVDLAELLGCDLEPDPTVPPVETRFGRISGRLERMQVAFPANEGRAVIVEATVFISTDWLGPPVIGWKGCLERVRIALDPDPEVPSFYFDEPGA